MKAFAELFQRLEVEKNNGKVAALVSYFHQAEDLDAAWALYLLDEGKSPARINGARLREAVQQASGLPLWLIEESYSMVGDLAETCALLIREHGEVEQPLHQWITAIQALKAMPPEQQIPAVLELWRQVPRDQLFVFNKLMTGGFRVGVARGLLSQALGQVLERPAEQILGHLMGDWQPSADAWQALQSGHSGYQGQPYPFFLATRWEGTDQSTDQFLVEYKLDGIRAQLVKRGDTLSLWPRGEECIDTAFPDLLKQAQSIEGDLVLDGELLVWIEGAPASFNALQKRLGRKKPSAKLMAEHPVSLVVYDLLEYQGQDLRSQPLSQRRGRLLKLDLPFPISEALHEEDWAAYNLRRESSRERRAEGLMVKRWDSPYRVGRKKGDWFKWKLDPLSLDVVLMYAQAGHGNRANLFSDYTLGVWHEGQLVPVAKAYSGLTRDELETLDRWIKANVVEKFGPVRQVPPLQVFELGFEGIQASPRHKSGIAMRFPRLLRWRQDKPVSEANTLADAQALLESYG